MIPKDFINQIIRPANLALGLSSPQAEQLILGTALQETGIQNIKQYGSGPAQGYFQDEPIDFNDLMDNYLTYYQDYLEKLKTLIPDSVEISFSCILGYPIFAAAICRLHYLRAPDAIPLDLNSQAAYYKQYYNTPNGAATTEEYISKWNTIVGEDTIANWSELMEN